MKTKINSLMSWQRSVAVLTLLGLILLGIYSPLKAQTVTEGFRSDELLQRGMIVSIIDTEDDSTNNIAATTGETASKTYGIVVSPNDSPVTLSEPGEQYFVATVGNFDVLVSNQSGNIEEGDYIAVSALPGIGMKAGDKDEIAVGRALVDFDPNKDIVSNVTLKDTTGNDFQVSVARLKVQINVAKNPLFNAIEPELPDTLKKIADSSAGKQVSALRAYVALAVLIFTAIAGGSVIYAGVRSAIISIGRNPLSKKVIARSMVKVVITGLAIFISGLFGVYLILRL
jgi:hypothetical protein